MLRASATALVAAARREIQRGDMGALYTRGASSPVSPGNFAAGGRLLSRLPCAMDIPAFAHQQRS